MKLINKYIDEVNSFENSIDKFKILECLEYVNNLLLDIEEAPQTPPAIDLKLNTEEYLQQRDNGIIKLTQDKKIKLFIDNLMLKQSIKELNKFKNYNIIQRLINELEQKFIYDKYKFLQPTKASYLNDSISKKLDTFENKQNYQLKLYKSYYLEYSYFENEGSLKLNNYSKSIYNCIATFYINGNDYFRASDVYKYLNGNRESDKINPNDIKEIESIIDSFQDKSIQIDIAKCRQDLNNILGIKNRLLRVRTLKFRDPRSSHEDYLFKIIERPFLLELQQTLNLQQIVTAPIEMLKNDRISKDTIVLKNYLIPIIVSIKNSKLNNKILYKTIFENTNIINDSKGKNKAKINKILDSFVKLNFIKSYKKTRDSIIIDSE